MQNHPKEPIITLDNDYPSDPFALDSPVPRAIATVSTAYKSDPVTTYFATPGKEEEFVRALVETLRQKGNYMVFECGTFCGVSFVRELDSEGLEAGLKLKDKSALTREGGKTEDSCSTGMCAVNAEEKEAQRMEALTDLAATGDTKELSLVSGVDYYTAGLLKTMQGDKLPQLKQYLYCTVPSLLHKYSQVSLFIVSSCFCK